MPDLTFLTDRIVVCLKLLQKLKSGVGRHSGIEELKLKYVKGRSQCNIKIEKQNNPVSCV